MPGQKALIRKKNKILLLTFTSPAPDTSFPGDYVDAVFPPQPSH